MRLVGYVCVGPGSGMEFHAAAAAMTRWCEPRGLTLTTVIHDVEPQSGRTGDRPGFAYGLSQIAAGAVDGLVLTRLRDLTGSVCDLGAMLRWLDAAQARVIALDFDIDTSTASGALALQALIEVSDWERDRLDARTRPGLATIRGRRGPARGRSVRDDPQLSARIRTLRASGMTLQAIADALNADGVPTVRGGTQWRPSSVQAAAGYRRPAAKSGGILLPPLRPLVQIRLTEVIQGLSYALDLTEGEPAGHAARSCLIGMRLADELGVDRASDRSDLFYALLLKDAGCAANAARMAALFGADDHDAKHSSKRVDWARPWPAFVWAARTAAPGSSLAGRTRRLLAVRAEGEVTRSLMQARCERGAEIARMLGLSEATAEAIYALDEHWDGAGHPHGLRGEEIPLGARIGCLAQTLEIFWADHGVEGAYAVAERRRGEWFDPALVAALDAVRDDASFWASLPTADLSRIEPADQPLPVDSAQLDRIAGAFAAVIDAKSPWTHRHSDRTSTIATGIAARLGADPATLRDLERAARLHDIGKLAISNLILDKPAPLTPAEFATVKDHPRITKLMLERVPGLREVAALAGAHHERLDGSGYPHGWSAPDLTMPMRVLAVADVYEALTSARPYRPARTSELALELMSSDTPHRLDADAVLALETLLKNPGAQTVARLSNPTRPKTSAEPR
jgi:HD-GYP domain-containing protein (c-di-GMP phosphodiesterase class II)/DNA invertase Pin-like site-specific DNA recombinase